MSKNGIVVVLLLIAVLFQFQYPAVFSAALQIFFCFLICFGAVISLHKQRNMLITIAAVTIATGTTVMAMGVQTIQLARTSIAWPSVTGEVSVLETAAGGAGAYGINHEFEYRYSILGKDYVNNQVSWEPVHWNTVQKAVLIQEYQQNSNIEVYYNPARPAKSRILRHLNNL